MEPGTLTSAQLAELRTALEAKREELRRVIAARLRATAEDDEELIEEGDVATRGIGRVDFRLETKPRHRGVRH